ncbi:hypothetical protein B0H34DRAFT_855699 [Crassisporium funariophilum]|nr:hypothetical protein B0H34DRAFT_855699 [Crassisporium funariophilum]
MSRPSILSFHKPPPFEFPLLLPSPPDTNSESIAAVPHMLPSTSAGLPEFGIHEHNLGNASSETAGTRFRRSSSIPYHSSGLREQKEKAAGHRPNKSLIIVIPPATLVQEHGHHGPTLSNGPFHRLSQGVVMPLLPSMSNQLTAIAREFNFPSISGLCLYLHYIEDGLTLTPRISDDSWQSLWGHLSDPLAPNERRPLISGKVEFDIDHRLARWYASWLSSIQRDIYDHPLHSYPSTAPSLAHFRAESRTTLADGRHPEDESAENSFVQHSAPITRHVPRKLSLVERFDSLSARPDIKVASRTTVSPPDLLSSGSQVLTTILQEEEPKTARANLDNRVKSWRASALLTPAPLAATGQTSLDPANLPNDMSIENETTSAENEVLKMEDYAWSISSAGPQSCGGISPTSWVRAPSVHLASRLQGSVCTTPSTCTSFGPADYSPYSSHLDFARIPTPDIAQRLYESVPSTPLTATSWGAPLSYPPSPTCHSLSGSLDIAHRLYLSAPPTPSTATSWGAPPSYPSSLRCHSPSPSLDLGERSMFPEVPGNPPQVLVDDNVAREVIDAWSERPWSHVWPYIKRHSALPTLKNKSQSSVWNRINLSRVIEMGRASGTPDKNIQMSFGYPYLTIYDAVYPHFDLYPPVPGAMDIGSQTESCYGQRHNIHMHSSRLPAVYPTIDIYPAVYPHNLNQLYPAIEQATATETLQGTAEPLDAERGFTRGNDGISTLKTRLESVYPSFNLYPAVYPYFDIYPSPSGTVLRDTPKQVHAWSLKTALETTYSSFNLYPAVYPYFDIYPGPSGTVLRDTPKQLHALSLKTALETTYPSFNLYPAVYPYFDIYPGPSGTVLRDTPKQLHALSLKTALETTYPSFNLYPAVYPYFDIYPGPSGTVLRDTPKQLHALSLKTALETTYPSFNLYPAVYPYFDIYSAVTGVALQKDTEQNGTWSLKTTLNSVYPSFNLYPAVYPHFDIYPHVFDGLHRKSEQDQLKVDYCPCSLRTTLKLEYPTFNLYPAVYPHFDIYPAPYMGMLSNVDTSQGGAINGSVNQSFKTGWCSAYPFFNLYPSVYPKFDLYPAPYGTIVSSESMAPRLPVSCMPERRYPIFNLYPAVYPYFDLYPPMPELATVAPVQTTGRAKNSSRLTHSELHAMVMMENVSSQRSFGLMEHRSGLGERRRVFNLEVSEERGTFDGSRATRSASALPSTPSRDILRPSTSFRARSMGFLHSVEEQARSSLRKPETSRERVVSRSIPTQTKQAPRRRDSIVLQRAKAFDSGDLSKEALSQFPMPPRSFSPLPQTQQTVLERR